MQPIAFTIGGFAIYWYGVMIALAFLVGLWTTSRRGILDGLPPDRIVDLGIWIIVAAIVGSRLFHVVAYWREEFSGQSVWTLFAIRRGGLYFYGGLIAASLTTVLYTRWKHLDLWKVADAFAPSIALGHVLGRIGCFLNGCCYGVPTDLPWAVTFDHYHTSEAGGVHPSQLYEAGANLIIYLGLAWLYRRKRFDGQVFGVYLIVYSTVRFGLEFFRGDYDQYSLGGWATAGHFTSLFVLAAGIVWLWLRARTKETPR